MKVLNLSLVCGLFLMLGCASAPKRDDYVKHVSFDANEALFENVPQFKLAYKGVLDVRGEYSSDNSVASNMAGYHGGAGTLGFLAQIAAHSAITESSKNDKLSAQQEEANKILAPVKNIISSTNLTDFVPGNVPNYQIVMGEEKNELAANIRPIFFVSPDFEYLSVKSVIWIEKKQPKRKNKKNKSDLKYQNIIEVISQRYTKEERAKLTENSDFFISELKLLFQQSLIIGSNELSGKYLNLQGKSKSYKLAKNNSNRYIRAQEVDSVCDKLVLRNLRNWLIAVPRDRELIPASNCSNDLSIEASSSGQ